MRQFSSWQPLDEEHADDIPADPAAIHVRREEGLVDYEGGKSAMVYYGYAEDDARETILATFDRELQFPGARGEGPLLVRWLVGGDEAREIALRRLFKFVRTFGEPPLFNEGIPEPPEEDGDPA